MCSLIKSTECSLAEERSNTQCSLTGVPGRALTGVPPVEGER